MQHLFQQPKPDKLAEVAISTVADIHSQLQKTPPDHGRRIPMLMPTGLAQQYDIKLLFQPIKDALQAQDMSGY